jgi:hypothetical protein
MSTIMSLAWCVYRVTVVERRDKAVRHTVQSPHKM